MLRKRIGSQDGFTLIELVVVVAILGILAVIVTPKVVGAIENARNNGSKSSAKQIQVAMERYAAEKGYYPTGAELCLATGFVATADNTCSVTTFSNLLSSYVNLANINSVKYNISAAADATKPATYVLTIAIGESAGAAKTYTISPASVTP